MTIRVTAPAVQVAIGSRVHHLTKGAVLPEGADEATLERLTAKGLIEAFEPEAGGESDAGANTAAQIDLPSESWNHEQIDKWASELDPPVTFAADPRPTKKEKIAALAPQIEAARAAAEQQ